MEKKREKEASITWGSDNVIVTLSRSFEGKERGEKRGREASMTWDKGNVIFITGFKKLVQDKGGELKI